MNESVLVVDDEINLLSSIRRQLRGQFELFTSRSGKEALEMMSKGQTFAVVVSDYKMPGMDGAAFLSQVKKISKDTVRMMLTGQADMDAVISVINQGNIFRFLTKPCPPVLLSKNINDCLEQYKLIITEKELLSKTLGGSLQVLNDILVLAKPKAFNRSIRIKDIVKKVLPYIKFEYPWQIEVAAMLSQIGCVTVPDDILNKVFNNQELEHEDRIIYQLHTKTSSDIITKIPRLEPVACIISYHEKYYNGQGMPNDGISGNDIPKGARLLRIVLDYDQLLQMETPQFEALEVLKNRPGLYDPDLIKDFEFAIKQKPGSKQFISKKVLIRDMNERMYLSDEIVSASGVIIGGKKQKVSKALIVTLSNYVKNKEIMEPVSVVEYTE